VRPRGVEVIGIPGIHPFDLDREAARVKKIVRRYAINFELVWGDDEFTSDVEEYEKFGYSARPQVFVISRDGLVVKRVRGFDGESDPAVLRAAVEEALKKSLGRRGPTVGDPPMNKPLWFVKK
jgi:hypothetical protein